MNIKNVKVIELEDWDDLVTNTYDKQYSFQQQDDCKERGMVDIIVPVKNPEDFENTKVPFEVNGEKKGVKFETWRNSSVEEIDKNFDSEWEAEIFWDRNYYPHEDMIINDLHSKGLLPEGQYKINIDW